MRKGPVLVTITVILFGSASACADQAPYPQNEEALQAAYDKLSREDVPGTYELTASHATLRLPIEFILLRDKPARHFMFLANGSEFPNTEMAVADPSGSSLVTFDYFDVGYVPDGDWNDLEADQLLDGIKEGNKQANEDRIRSGVSLVEVKGWLEEPKYDSARSTAYWVIEGFDPDGPLINATAVRLGRYGYHEVTWIGESYEFQGAMPPMLETLLARYDYNHGSRYADYVTGNKLAGLGLASLVAVSAGSKTGKGLMAAIFAAGLMFLKKGWIIILAVLVCGWTAITRLFGRRSSKPSTMHREQTWSPKRPI